MKTISNLIGVVVLILLVVLSLRNCGQKATNKGNTDTFYQVDTLTRTIPGPVRDTTLHDTLILPSSIDTLAVILDYFTARVNQRQYQDSNISISIVDTVYRNHIASGPLTYKVLKPCTSTVIREYRRGLFVGGFFQASKQELNIGPVISYQAKNTTFSFSTGIIKPQITFGLQKRLW